MKIFRLVSKWWLPILLIGNYLIVIYRILAIWQPPLPHQISPLFHYMGIPPADLLFPATLAVNLVHQHGSVVNWVLSPAPYFFPDLLILVMLAYFTQNIFMIILIHGLIQIVFFTFFSYLVARLTTRSRIAGYLILFSILLALSTVSHPLHLPTFGTINIILAPMMHFSITIMSMVLLLLILYKLRGNAHPVWIILFSLLFLATSISDLGLLIYFSIPLFIALLINYSTQEIKKNLIPLLVLIVFLSFLACFIYKILPLHINHMKRDFGFHYDYLIHLLSLFTIFFKNSPIVVLLWLLFFICAPISWLRSYRNNNSDQAMINFVISLLFLQIFITIIIFNFFPMLLTLSEHIYPMRYLQPAIVLSIFIGLPLLFYKHCHHLIIRKQLTILAGILLFIIAILNLMHMPSLHLKQAINPYPPMIACLDKQAKRFKLHHGITGYEDASVINATNQSNITVTSSVVEKDSIMRNYLNNIINSKTPQFDFIVTSTPPHYYLPKDKALWLSPSNVSRIVGPPTFYFNCFPYTVFVYKNGEINQNYADHG